MPSTASVLIKTKGGVDISSGQLLSIVDWVAGTVSGLKRENINVIVNGQRTYRGPDDNTAMPTNVLEVKKSIEDNLEAKLAKMFASMGDVKIAVNVTPDLSVRHRQSTTYDPKGTVSKPRQETNRETSTIDGTAAGGEPGAVPNASANVADTAPAGRKSTSTTSDVHTDNVVMIGQTFLDEVLPAGTEWKEMTASISLPRSYFVSLYHKRGGDDKTDPDDKKLNDLGIIDQEIKSATARAKNSIGAKSNDQIQVDWYDDTIMAKNAEVVMASSAFAAGNMPAIMQYAKQGVLALIALGAMGMMLMMVRKAVPAGGDSEIDAGVFITGGKKGKRKGGGAGLEQFETVDDVFGEANQGEAVLTGIELDDETLASRKMVDEVSTMIKENPENAATLVKRWMTKNK